MTHTKDEALSLALEALEGVVKNCWRDIPSWRLDEIKEQITAIKQAIAAPVQPVGRVCFGGDEVVWTDEPPESGTLLYTAAQPAPAPSTFPDFSPIFGGITKGQT